MWGMEIWTQYIYMYISHTPDRAPWCYIMIQVTYGHNQKHIRIKRMAHIGPSVGKNEQTIVLYEIM